MSLTLEAAAPAMIMHAKVEDARSVPVHFEMEPHPNKPYRRFLPMKDLREHEDSDGGLFSYRESHRSMQLCWQN
jgi:hypothetical protein